MTSCCITRQYGSLPVRRLRIAISRRRTVLLASKRLVTFMPAYYKPQDA